MEFGRWAAICSRTQAGEEARLQGVGERCDGLAGEVEADGGARVVEQAHDGAGVGVGDDRALLPAGAEEITEVGGLVVEAVADDGVVELERRAGERRDGGAGGVPPGLVDGGEAKRAADRSDAGGGEREAGVELREAVLVARLDDGEGVHRRGAGGGEGGLGEGVNVGGGAEPVDGEEGLVDADGHEGSTGAIEAPGGVAGWGEGAAVAGLDEGDGTEGAGRGGGASLPCRGRREVIAKGAVEREKGRLHGFHEEEVAGGSEGEEIVKLGEGAGDRLLAEDGQAGGEGGVGKGVVGVRQGGDVDGLDAGGEEGLRRADGEGVVGGGEGAGLLWPAGEDGGDGSSGDVGKIAGEAAGDGTGTEDAPADGAAGDAGRGEHGPSLDDGEQKDGDIVAAAVSVGGADEAGAGMVELGLGGRASGELTTENVGEGGVVELAGEAIGAEEIEVAGLGAVAVGIGLETAVGADGAGDEVAHGRDGGLVCGDVAGLELLLDEGVVTRELLEGAGAETVAAAIADICEKEIGRGDEAGRGRAGDGAAVFEGRRDIEEADEGGAHAGVVRRLHGERVDDGVGGEDGGLKTGLRLGVGRRRGAKVLEKGGGGETAGDLAGGGSAHAVAHHKGADLRRDGAGILVVAAGATDIGQHGVDEWMREQGLRRWVLGNCTRARQEGKRPDRGMTHEALRLRGRGTMNRIVMGDNLEVLRGMEPASASLIYVDPPFNTGRQQTRTRMRTVQDEAGDRVGFGGKRYRTERIVAGDVGAGGAGYADDYDDFIGFLRPRMVEARRVLSATGSVFVHLDPREVHYAKVMLDEVFGRRCFQNEIIWAYDYGARAKRRWPAKHDNILWYTQDPERYTFNLEACDRIAYMAPELVGPEKAAVGKTPTDVWWHTIVSPTGKEKTGYPTQKPVGVLERIVLVHSNPGELVLDFFAGSGTTGEAAARHGREFLMVDASAEAIALMQRRLGRWMEAEEPRGV